ncbi:MAG: DUF6132 family protein [Maribacter sp.]|nr:DUF6132 family protein [Maribacter sp.]
MTKKGMIFTVIGLVIGGFAGYFYYVEIGCISGSCPITSKPVNSTLYGAFIGGLLFNMFERPTKK